jgi:CRISPR/Cas system-associated endonuclease Cas1
VRRFETLNPLYINESVVSLSIEDYHLKIYNPEAKKTLCLFKPRTIPYDSIVIQRKKGSVSFAAIDWLQRHAVSLLILRWTGDILAQVLPEQPANPELRLAQYESYLDESKHLSIVKGIAGTKMKRQAEFLKAISHFFDGIAVRELRVIKTDKLILVRTEVGR